GKEITLTHAELEEVGKGYDFLSGFSKDKVIYGINTGFGPMAQYRIDDLSLRELQYNIIRSHACGAGEPLPRPYVRAAMVARLMTFVQGRSGVHPRLPQLLSEFINRDICPVVPEHGSVGASGDLVQLSHIALALIGEGDVFYGGERRPAAEVLAANSLEPLSMYGREGLAVTNGTAVMTGIGLVNLVYARTLLDCAVKASVMVNEIVDSYDDFMSVPLNESKLHRGQRLVAEAMRGIAASSKRMKKREVAMYSEKNQEKIFSHKLQPYYSLRCVPQVLGPVWDQLDATERVLVDELHSVDDNPVVDPQTGSVYHGGNFHGDYVSFEMDKLKIAVTKMTMLAERQMNYLFHDKLNEMLPPFLNKGVLGLNYGLQALQFTATSTTAECQTLSNPMYVHSIPNNNDNQDIVSMGTNSALIARRVIDNAFQVMAIHYMALAQAVDCLGIEESLSDASRDIYGRVRELSAEFGANDVPRYGDIERVIASLKEI
ncbi:aromatic amino acid ammonia-lyase, partial [Alistipes sp. OttesenSCG-928-B03]|nr:aromatic amino acid ammonia-lyase [Alistipes sp. OttesenSCG-928-B03]